MTEETVMKFVEAMLGMVITAAVPVITGFLVAWINSKRKEVEGKIPAEIMYAIRATASMVVTAAEQSGLTNELLATGKAKKQWAMQMGEEWLRAQFGASPNLNKLTEQMWNAILSGLDLAIEEEVGHHNGVWYPQEKESLTGE